MLSVIISTYERPQMLRLVLEGILIQTGGPFEVIVADDGSGPETKEVVAAFRARAPFRVEHVWQEDLGFRAARIRNLGAGAARGARLLFLDGDCIPLPGFLEAHAPRKRQDHDVFIGDRLFLDRDPSAALTIDDVARGRLSSLLPRTEHRRLRWRALKNRFYLAIRQPGRPRIVTANLSLSRAAFEDVNGLDERFVGWGLEDDDLCRRLRRRGLRFRSILTRAKVCHLWHAPVASFPGRVRDGVNREYFSRGYFLTRCRHGMRTRPLSECGVAWNGETLPGIQGSEISIAWGQRPLWRESEMRVFVATPAAPLPPSVRTPEICVVPFGVRLLMPAPSRTSARTTVLEVDAPIDPETAVGRERILAELEPHI